MVSIILPYYNRKDLVLQTLRTFEHFYSDKDLEVVIVDDMSDEEHRLEDSLDFNLNINLVRLEEKTGINPCYPYNVGVRESSGDILILSSPETFHTNNMFELTNDFEGLNDDTYFLFSVFCLTHDNVIESIGSSEIGDALNIVNAVKAKFYQNLGENGYPFNNNYGSWYTHSVHRDSGLNFFTAITRNRFYELSGFDERFRGGTGFDDDEFRDRLYESGVEFKYVDDVLGIHVDHAIVNDMPPTTNSKVYSQTRTDKYEKNDLWGKR
jgi:glycosyltransferase involved in cell wall biosynthesis